MTKTATTSPYDVAEHLRTREDMAAYLEASIEEADGDAAFPVLAGQEVVAGSRPRRNRKAGSRTGGRRGAVMPGRAPTANAAGKSRREITKGTCRTGESRQVAVQATIKVDWRGYAVHEG